jgi:hypothetical protein
VRQIDHHRQAPSIPIGDESKEERADRPKRQGQGNRPTHFFIALMKFLADGREA